ncbi:MAG TPA: 2'-5' RNA ligase family protein [Pyrinomonadaceae bacterium]|jgi:2'-5' RNA ligase
MALLVLAYPRLARADYDWIQAVRAQHDERYFSVVAPHFTLVFPFTGMTHEAFGAHVRRQAAGVRAVSFVLRCAIVVEDDSRQFSHVFLVPDEGFGEIVRLHDRLYRDALAASLRLDITFIPHVGVGNGRDARACKALADELNARPFGVAGTIDTLDVVWYEHGRVQTVEQIALA